MHNIHHVFAALCGDDQNLDYLDCDYDSTKEYPNTEKPDQVPAPAQD
tara:strand:+ start:1281 stop:1421 length:141 start_codon:yes stop_codon:yes gene_type:complete